MAAGEVLGPAAFNAAADVHDSAWRGAVQLAAVIFALSALMMVTREAVQLGVNLFTAELLLMAAAATMLLRRIYRLI
jgi:hypothetical protein